MAQNQFNEEMNYELHPKSHMIEWYVSYWKRLYGVHITRHAIRAQVLHDKKKHCNDHGFLKNNGPVFILKGY